MVKKGKILKETLQAQNKQVYQFITIWLYLKYCNIIYSYFFGTEAV